jgi:hypothetical protein
MTRRVHKGGTYYEFAASEAGAVGGRYGAISKTQVTGAASVPQYPSQPPGSPWRDEPCGLEPPFPIDIGPAAVVGEPHEVAASLGEVYSNDVGDLLPKTLDSASPGDGPRSAGLVPPASEAAPSPPSKRRRKA